MRLRISRPAFEIREFDISTRLQVKWLPSWCPCLCWLQAWLPGANETGENDGGDAYRGEEVWHKKVVVFSWCTLILTPSTWRNQQVVERGTSDGSAVGAGILSGCYEAVKGEPQYLARYELESVAATRRRRLPIARGRRGDRSLAVRDWEEFEHASSGNRLTRTAWKWRSVAWRRCRRLAACRPRRGRREWTPGTVGSRRQVPQGAGSDDAAAIGFEGTSRRQHGLRTASMACPKAWSGRSNSNIPRRIRRACGRP